MNSAIAGYLGASISVPIILWLLRKILPELSKYEITDRPFEDLKKEFSKWEFFGGICLILLTAAIGYIWWILLSQIGLLSNARFTSAIICVTASGYAWALPAMAAGMASGAVLTEKLIKALLKNKYIDYIAYQNEKYQTNTEKLKYPILVLISTITLAMILILLNWYTIFTYDNIIISSLFKFSKVKLEYSDVHTIHTAHAFIAPNGNTVQRREYMINFNNGYTWKTCFCPTDLTVAQKIRIADFVSHASGIPITEVQVFKRGELY